MSGPFDIAARFGDAFPKYDEFLRLFDKLYGIRDPHAYYKLHRQALLDKNLPDPWSITKHKTLDDWWNAKRLNYHYRAGPTTTGRKK